MESDLNKTLQNLLFVLHSRQQASGEFKLLVNTGQSPPFHVGESPFLTSLIAYNLTNLDHPLAVEIKQKSLSFLKKLDSTGAKIYKYWYGDVKGTDFIQLPYDLDDTAVVSSVFSLNDLPTFHPDIALINQSDNGQFYTWIIPSVKLLSRFPNLIRIWFEWQKANTIFKPIGGNPKMAEKRDSELMVRLNVWTALNLMGANIKINEPKIPITLQDVEKELSSSLHYENPSMYYYTLGKFQTTTNFIGTETIHQLSSEIHALIPKCNLADKITLWLTLILINQFNKQDYDDFQGTMDGNQLTDAFMELCVGNKTFAHPHTYISSDFSLSAAISILDFGISQFEGKTHE